MSAHPRLLLIDDDQKLARLLADYLVPHGFEVSAVHDGAEGIRTAQAGGWDLIVLDVMLPTIDGFGVLKHLRTVSDVPIVMLTARGGDEDRISGLDHGADDYVPKTSSARELLSRIRAVLRRASPAPSQTASPEIVVGDLRLDTASRQTHLRGMPLELTPVEFDLLLVLARHAGRICSREQLLEDVRDRAFSEHDRSVDVHIASLRRKLGDDPRNPHFIRTVRAAGYMLMDGSR